MGIVSLCAEEVRAGRADVNWWHPTGTKSEITGQGLAAKRICARCPNRDACLTEHLHEELGIWGGLGPGARAQAREGNQR